MQKQGSCVVIRECLKRLSPAHRTVLDLIYYHEQSIAEVARIIGVPENTVKTRAYYARKCVAQMLAERGIGREALERNTRSRPIGVALCLLSAARGE